MTFKTVEDIHLMDKILIPNEKLFGDALSIF